MLQKDLFGLFANLFVFGSRSLAVIYFYCEVIGDDLNFRSKAGSDWSK